MKETTEQWVECVEEARPCLTNGKKYKAEEDANSYWLTDDRGERNWWFKRRFKPCDPPNRKIIKYRLIKTYPAYTSLGIEIDAGASLDHDSYFLPEYWKPIYEQEKPLSETITIGSKNTIVKISKGKIEAEGKDYWYDWIKCFLLVTEGNTNGDYHYLMPTIEIGCATFTRKELETVVEIFERLNK